MTQKQAIQLFEDRKVRTVWDERTETWYFSVLDVISALTDTVNPTDYFKKMRKRDEALASFVGTNCPQIAMRSETGVMRKTLAGDVKTVLRIIQSIPSQKAEPFKQWMAQVASDRLDQMQDPELSIEQAVADYKRLGYSDTWINQRLKSIEVRKLLTDEHFGGKEGLYAVVVDREMRALTDVLINALSDPQAHPRQIVERTALALLTYVEENAEGFRVLTRDSPKTDPSNSFNSLLGDIAVRVEDILTDAFKRQHLPAKSVPYYAQMLIGMTVYTCQYWADQRKLSKEQLAAHIVNLAWYGLSRMEAKPELRYESEKAAREAEKQAAREAKAIAKQEKQGKKAAKSQEKAVAAGDDATDGTTVTDGSQAADGSQAVGKSQAADESNESDETNESQKPQSPHESQKQSTIDEN